jgi:ribosomal-protein-alanine N-acetyltransferase
VAAETLNGFSLCQVSEAEAGTLTEIHEKCFPRYWNREAFTDFFSVKGTCAFLVEENDNPVAMMVYRISFEQADIMTIAVLPQWRRRGIAEKMLSEMLAKCRNTGVKKIFLEVEDGNISAFNLYEKCGFKQIGRRKLYYQQLDGSYTDALVMEKKLV